MLNRFFTFKLTQNIFWVSLFLALTNYNCTSKKQVSKEIIVNTVHKIRLPLPKQNFWHPDYYQFVKIDDREKVLIYFYPKSSIFIYDIEKRELERTIPIYKNLIGIDKFHYFNKDSIWVFGNASLRYNFDSSLYVMDIEGKIKFIANLNSPFVVTQKKYPDLYTKGLTESIVDSILFLSKNERCSKFILDNKIFFGLSYSGDGEKEKYYKHPIIGYYDINSDTVFQNKKFYYPGIHNGIYYPRDFYDISLECDKNENLLISFEFTPKVIVWDFNHNRSKQVSLKTDLFEAIKGSSVPREDWVKEIARFGPVYYLKKQNLYVRFGILSDKYDNNRVLMVFDDQFNFVGEKILFKDKKYIPYLTNDSLLMSHAFVDKDSVEINLFSLQISDKENQNELIKTMDSLKINREKRLQENCILKNDSTYETKNILEFLKKNNYSDTVFSIIILNYSGCHSCNEYILKFLSVNRHVLFNLKKKPFYTHFVAEDINKNTIEYLLDKYNLKDNIKIDTTDIYKYFNPFDSWNPRLILVQNHKIVSDAVYMPDDLENMVERLLSFYGLETE